MFFHRNTGCIRSFVFLSIHQSSGVSASTCVRIPVGGHVIVFGVRGDTVDEIIGDLGFALAGLVGAGGLNDVSQHSDRVCLACLAKQKELRELNRAAFLPFSISLILT